jgi:hypothetical protein
MVTRVVTIDVLSDRLCCRSITTGVINDGNALVVSLEGSLAKVSHATSPENSALSSIGGSGTPCAELDLHGSLGESRSTLGILVCESADDNIVNDPVDDCGCPLDGVDVELSDGVCNRVEGSSVVCAHIALAKVVGLDLSIVTS